MSRRIPRSIVPTSIGFRISGTHTSINQRACQCIRVKISERHYSRKAEPKQAGVSLDEGLWKITSNLSRTLRNLLSAQKDYASILKANPTDDEVADSIKYWKDISRTAATSKSSYLSSSETYELFRQLWLVHKRETLKASDVRGVLQSLVSLRRSEITASGEYPLKMFWDLPKIWNSPWTREDFNLIFKILPTFEESISTMRTIHKQKLEDYPDANCWARVFESLNGEKRDLSTLRKCEEGWSLMRRYKTKPTIATYNALFGVACHITMAVDLMRDIYQKQLVPSGLKPEFTTLRLFIEAQMELPNTEETISDGNVLFEQLLDMKRSESHDPEYWDTILKWMVFRGEPTSNIKHTIYERNNVLGRNLDLRPDDNRGLTRIVPDSGHTDDVVSTLNQLIHIALRKDDIATAKTIYEDYFSSFGVTPSFATDELKLEVLIEDQDTDGAKWLYDELKLQGYLVPPQLVLRLLQCLSNSGISHAADVQTIFFDLLDRQDVEKETYRAAFATTISTLYRAKDYPRVRQTLVDPAFGKVPAGPNILTTISLGIIEDPKNIFLEEFIPVYHIVHTWAPDAITLSHRHTIMEKIIARGRTDIGFELFHDMRNSAISQPTRETYIIMLSGCAKTRDAQTLEHVHNALRLDSSIEPDTDLFNSLMLCYNRCRLPLKSLSMWEVLSESSRPPDVETAALALEACVQLRQYSLIRARQIWSYLEKNKIEPSPNAFAALLAVFARVGKWDGMMGLLERMDRDKVNAKVLGIAYNYMRKDRRDEVELWAKLNKPDVWEYLEQLK